MSSFRRHADLSSPGGAYYAAASCFAVSGIMSLTYFRSDWGDRGMVMIGIMAVGFIAGVVLIRGGRRMARLRSLFAELWVDTPSEALLPGQKLALKVGLLPARDLKVEHLRVRVECYERAAPEGEPMHASTCQVVDAFQKVSVGKTLGTAQDHSFEVDLVVPPTAPSTFKTHLHQVGCRLHLEVEGKGFSPVTQSWEVAVQGLPRGPETPEADFGSRVELEGLALTLDSGSGATQGKPWEAELVLTADEAMKHSGVQAVLVWTVEGESVERHEVAELELTGPGEFPEGESRLPLSVDIPADCPASYRGDLLRVRWELEVSSPGLMTAGATPPLLLKVSAAG